MDELSYQNNALYNIDGLGAYPTRDRGLIATHYARGGREITSGPDAGDGALSPLKAVFVTGFTATDAEIDDLVAFLETLTDEQFLTDERFSDPWR